MSTSLFTLDRDAYTRQLEIVKYYVEQQAFVLSRTKGIPWKDAKEYVVTMLKERRRGIINPPTLGLQRTNTGDRERVESTFLSTLKDMASSGKILSPSGVLYDRPSENKSLTGEYLSEGIAKRKAAKQLMFKYKNEGDKGKEAIYKALQNALKIRINSLSGMHGSSGTILYIKTGHSSLTSMCRAATSYCNAHNERFIAGTRHLWSPDITIANITSTVYYADYEIFNRAVELYNLHLPTVDEVMGVIEWSTRFYWKDEEATAYIRKLVEGLTPIERAVFVYKGDMYHLKEFNPGLVRTFFDAIIKDDMDGSLLPYDDTLLKNTDGDTQILVKLLACKHMVVPDLHGPTGLQTHHPEEYAKVQHVGARCSQALERYALLIRAVWVVETLPVSTANFYHAVRRSVLLSDTDSTVFTVMKWVEWYYGTIDHSVLSDGAWFFMTYLTTSVIIHILALFSANLGVEKEHLNLIAAKNEYGFPAVSLTSLAKHYYGSIFHQEGNIYKTQGKENKGVGLRPSMIAESIVKAAQALQDQILSSVYLGKPLSVYDVYDVIYRYEMCIEESVNRSDPEFLKTGQIKSTYAKLESSPYRYHELWMAVFAHKYGNPGSPPYVDIKVPLLLKNKTMTKAWIADVEKIDADVARRLESFLTTKGIDKVESLRMPRSLVSDGFPDEVKCAMSVRRLTREIMGPFYIILESTGIFQVHDDDRVLIRDVYQPAA